MIKCLNSRKLLIYILFAFLAGCSKAEDSSARVERPNVLFIVVDDLNDYPGAFKGHPQALTPNIDKLARSGTVFDNAHSNSPICSPSRNSLFTGVYPHDSKDFDWTTQFEQPVLKNNKTLMELFAENGYHVAGSGKLLHVNQKKYWHEWGVDIDNYGPFAFNGKDIVGHPSVPTPFRDMGPFNGSFAPISDVPHFSASESGDGKAGWLYKKGTQDYFQYTDENNRDLLPDEMHAQWAAQKILALEKQDGNQPFFIGVGFVRPHTPLYAPQKYFDMFPLDKIELPPRIKGDAKDTRYKDIYPAHRNGLRLYRALRKSYGGNAELGLKHFLQAYLACVAFVDAQIGTVIDALENSKFSDNTIIVLISDNGWQMGEKGYLYKNSPWEESTRVPLIIRTPTTRNGSTVSHPVSLIDIYPTLADLSTLVGDNRKNDSGGALGGYSLKPFLENPDTETWPGPRGALSVIGYGINKTEVSKQTYSYRTRDWRYILYFNGEEELYDHRKDPSEWNNLAEESDYATIKKVLKKEMLDLIY
jgi:arylsulfatase A-like enzyme